jgi:intein-encoded DNA endonuclease-like protein
MKIDKNKVLDLRNNGLNCREIAKIVGCSNNHVGKILRENFNLRVICPYVNRKYYINEAFLDDMNKESAAYFLGLMFADGNVDKKNHSVKLGLVESDISILLKLSEYIQPTKPLSILKQSKGHLNLRALIINSKKFKNKLISLGCIPNKTYSLAWPNYNFNLNGIRHFLRGYFDGDGCFYVGKNNNGKIYFNVTGYKDIINSIKKYLIENLSINCSIRVASKTGCQDILSLNIYGARQVELLGDFIYKDSSIFLGRKYNKYLLIKNRPNKRALNG